MQELLFWTVSTAFALGEVLAEALVAVFFCRGAMMTTLVRLVQSLDDKTK